MSEKYEYLKQNSDLRIFVECKGIQSEPELRSSLIQYQEALAGVREKLLSGDLSGFCRIDVITEPRKPEVNETPPSTGMKLFGLLNFRKPKPERTTMQSIYERTVGYQYPLGLFELWDYENEKFWKAVLENKELRPILRDVLRGVIETAKLGASTMTLYGESDEIHFGEPLFTALALTDIEFVPFYTDILRQWDVDHEVMQATTINAIFEKYGICPEVEDSLVCRLSEAIGQCGIDNLLFCLPKIEEHYGPFTKSALFKNIVVQCHKVEVASYEQEVATAKSDHAKRLLENPKAAMRRVPSPRMSYLGDDELIVRAAESLFEDLEAARLL